MHVAILSLGGGVEVAACTGTRKEGHSQSGLGRGEESPGVGPGEGVVRTLRPWEGESGAARRGADERERFFCVYIYIYDYI